MFIRDRVSRALAARSLLQALLLPKAQVELEVQVLTIDTDTNYQYGISPPTSATFFNLGKFNSLSSCYSGLDTFTQLFSLGGGLSLFGLGVGEATSACFLHQISRQARAMTRPVSQHDGMPVTVHFGDKYPIPQSLYTGLRAEALQHLHPGAANSAGRSGISAKDDAACRMARVD